MVAISRGIGWSYVAISEESTSRIELLSTKRSEDGSSWRDQRRAIAIASENDGAPDGLVRIDLRKSCGDEKAGNQQR